jgi:hypothetical protein
MGDRRAWPDIGAEIAAATVRVTGYPSDVEKAGLGVLVGNGYLATAAHCLEFDHDTGARITLGEYVCYGVETAEGEKLKAAPVFIESVSDIAILGPLDRNVFDGEWAGAYESFCERTRPVPIWRGPVAGTRSSPRGKAFRVHIHTHERSWIEAEATFGGDGRPHVRFDAEMRIEGRSSGGPVVNDSGELLAVVTAAGGYLGLTREGRAPLLRHALPPWLFREICGIRLAKR